MKVSELALEMTEKACRDIIRTARAVPQEKLNWGPDGARSTLDILQEVSSSAMWPVMLGLAEKVPPFDQEEMAKQAEARKALDTVDKCEAELNKNMEQLRSFLRAFPESRLDEKLELPFMPGLVMTRGELLFTHYWNTTYHTGQINYLQTMLGDKEMH